MCLPPPRKFLLDTYHPKDCSQDLRTPHFSPAMPNEISKADFTYFKANGSGNPVAPNDALYRQEEDILYIPPSPPKVGCIENVYIDPPPDPTTYLPDVCSVTNNHYFGSASDNVSSCRYRVYYPRSTWEGFATGHDYETVPLPCVVLFHPGGFQECQDHIQPGMVTMCTQFALRGFVAITVDYRGGRLKDSDATLTSVQQQLAPYRAIQDARGAIRSIIKRNASTDLHGNRFKIDEDQFFIGGMSAGAIAAMGATYYRNQAMINAAYFAAPTSLTIEQALGHINADYYYGEPGSDLENPIYWPVIRGALNCWGGIVIPKSKDGGTDSGMTERAFFKATGTEDPDRINPPMIGFAGLDDDVIFFSDDSDQYLLFSTDPPWRKTNFCLATSGSYTLKKPNATNPVYSKQCSALNMYNFLKGMNMSKRFTELYIDCDMRHGINNIATDNFSIIPTATSKDDVYTYIVIRAAIFFQTIMNVSVSGPFPPFNYRKKSLFVDTMNNRICTDCDGDAGDSAACSVVDNPCSE